MMNSWQVRLGVLTCVVIFMSAGYTMLIPFLPMYLIKELGVDPADVKMWNGAIFSVTFFIGGCLAPLWGKMADKYGKRLMGIRSAAGLALAYFLGSIVQSPEQMFIVRAIQGLAAGLISVCFALASSFVPPSKIGVGLGIIQTGLTLGNIAGPLIGGMLATYFGMRASFVVASCFLTMITLAFIFVIPEPEADPKAKSQEEEQQGSILSRPAILECLILCCLVYMVILFIQPIMTLYVGSLEGVDNVMLLSGLSFSLVGVASAITAPIWGSFGQKKGFHISLMMASFLAAIGNILAAMPRTFTLFCVCNFVYGLFFAGVVPSITSILATHTEKNERGRVYAYMFSFQQVGSVIGPLLGGLLATYFPMQSVFYAAAFVLFGVSGYTYLKYYKK
ncbi:MAG: MFS transporter [Phascolarctobacterium sp.]|nr:MFS transporter [Phascolarctobacterium sp.]